MYARQPFVVEHSNGHRRPPLGVSSPRLDNWFAQPPPRSMYASKPATAESHRSFTANARGTGTVASHFHHHSPHHHSHHSEMHCSGDELESRPYYQDVRGGGGSAIAHSQQLPSQSLEVAAAPTPHRFVRVSQAFPHVLTAGAHSSGAGMYDLECNPSSTTQPDLMRRRSGSMSVRYNNYGTPPAGPMGGSPAMMSVSTVSPLMIKVPSSDSSISHCSEAHSCALLSSSRTPTTATAAAAAAVRAHVVPAMDVSEFDRRYYNKQLRSSDLGQRYCGAELTRHITDFLSYNCCTDEECLPGIGESVMSDISQHNWYPYFTRGFAALLGPNRWHEMLANTRIFVECEPLLLIARRCLTVNEMFNVKADFSQLFALLIPDKQIVGDDAVMSYLRGCLKPISSTTRSFFQDVVFFDGLQCARGFPLILPLMRQSIGDDDMWKEFVMAASEQLAVFEAMRWTKVPSVEYLNTLVPSEMTRDDPFFWTSQCRSADGLTLLEHCYHMDRHFSRFEARGNGKNAISNPRVAVVKEWLSYSVITAMRLSATQ